jgi:adenylosuccinate synthase
MKAYLLVDLTFGDAAKGATVDWLARGGHGGSAEPVHTVVRFNGGPQAGHNVVTPDGRHHTFSSFGSATFVPGVATYLSRHVLVNPLNALKEAAHLAALGVPDALDRLAAHPACLVVTPYHVAANRLRELAREAAGEGRHGSCGMGIGETVADALADPDGALRVGDLRSPAVVAAKLDAVRQRKRKEVRDFIGRLRGGDLPPSPFPKGKGRSAPGTARQEAEQQPSLEQQVRAELRVFGDDWLVERFLAAAEPFVRRVTVANEGWLAERVRRHPRGATVFEPAQGTLLDEDYGFHPHTTWSHTTLRNAVDVLDATGFDGRVERIGLVRAYSTRHGDGPFVVNDAAMAEVLRDPHNRPGAWQGAMRCGPFDAAATRYALAVNAPYGGVDSLSVSHLDCVGEQWSYCDRYEHDGPPDEALAVYADGPAPEDGRTRPRQQIADLRAQWEADLARQQRLTELLSRCRPVVQHVPRTALVEKIEELVRLPVGIVATGPKAEDRRWV